MTKKLEELFNLPEKEEAEKKPDHTDVKSIDDSIKAVEAITNTLPQIKELDNLDDKELDALASKAEQAYTKTLRVWCCSVLLAHRCGGLNNLPQHMRPPFIR